jgi:hypothetical protein
MNAHTSKTGLCGAPHRSTLATGSCLGHPPGFSNWCLGPGGRGFWDVVDRLRRGGVGVPVANCFLSGTCPGNIPRTPGFGDFIPDFSPQCEGPIAAFLPSCGQTIPAGIPVNSLGPGPRKLPPSLRLPGEGVSQCVTRVQEALLGKGGAAALQAGGLVGTATSIASNPSLFTMAVPVSPDLFRSAGHFGRALFRSSLIEAVVFEAATVHQTLRASAVGASQRLATRLYRVAPLATAIILGIEGGFWISCR